ncbi:putative Asparagine synthase (Glutamine-hydrolyzing) [uncultured Sphingopyxis sp.]|uniref:asparagine synthase (glutamine-hydrolyzing) n=1 Tax=uncultured Sphingopyxis sp. TaxID=310581 RepID=A0A1Y5PP34_9SPHN|nr:asparagine synthase C-terminal domain-containing protein [uncultured Sphingopyxis sp.]SBV31779.1 putative Asparagine synthase (Glutamine-hydrolyzing) [uncultured Sphingopyxis sp.]
MTRPRYLAILDPLETGAAERMAARSGALGLVYRTTHTTVLAGAETPFLRDKGTGILIGRLFAKADGREIKALPSPIASGDARSLIGDYWGDYLILGELPARSVLQAIRAPSGTLQAYRIRQGPVTYLTSDVEIALEYGLIIPAINWHFVAYHLAFLHLRSAATGLAGLDEMMPGEVLRLDGGRATTRSLWTPWAFAAPERRVAAMDEASNLVANAVRNSIKALVRPADRVLLELSGGLDSSIIAAALSEAGREIVALNLATSDPGGDERDYARTMAAHCAISLCEAQVEEAIDLTADVPALTARPGLPAMLRSADSVFSRLAREENLTAYVSGTGGDCVFCSLSSAAPAADYLRSHGPKAALATIVRDIAAIHRTNSWHVTRLMLKQLLNRKSRAAWRRNEEFLNEDRLPSMPPAHPWLDGQDRALSGTRAHVRAIIAANAHLDGYGRQEIAPSLYPLLSQPVVEACLAVPTWLWVEGGYDRAVARNAFSRSLPAAIVTRRTKGSMDAFCARIFDQHRMRLLPFLLDGLLASAGFLDRPAIEAYLTRPFGNRDDRFYHLLPIADTEAWARGVQARSS